MKFRRTEHTDVEAWQFKPGTKAPEWVDNAISTGRLQFTDFSGTTIRITGGTHIDTASRIAAGGWIVRYQQGGIVLMTECQFAETFKPVPDEPGDFAEGIAAGLTDFERAQG